MRRIAIGALVLGCSTLSTVAWARNDCGPRGDEPCPEKGKPTGHEEAAPAESGGGDDWSHFELKGFHPFVGVGLMGGPALPFSATSGKPGSMGGSFLFSLRGGFYAGRNEFAIEMSPITYISVTPSRGPNFQLAFNYTGFIPIAEGSPVSVYWPMRVGFGFAAVNMPSLRGDAAYMQLRFDLIGIAIKVGHVMIDLSFPSFRHTYSPGDSNGNAMIFSWHIGAQVGYIF
jgi:hypothetical protein